MGTASNRSFADCLMVRVAIEYGLVLLYEDRDFESVAKVIPRPTPA